MRCSCGVCECTYPAAFTIQDHTKTRPQLAQLHQNKTLFQDDKITSKQDLHMFLCKTSSTVLLDVEGVRANKDNIPRNKQDHKQLATQLVYNDMAGAMVCVSTEKVEDLSTDMFVCET